MQRSAAASVGPGGSSGASPERHREQREAWPTSMGGRADPCLAQPLPPPARPIGAMRRHFRRLHTHRRQPHHIRPDQEGLAGSRMPGRLVYEPEIRPHISAFDKSERTGGTSSRADRRWVASGWEHRLEREASSGRPQPPRPLKLAKFPPALRPSPARSAGNLSPGTRARTQRQTAWTPSSFLRRSVRKRTLMKLNAMRVRSASAKLHSDAELYPRV